MGSERPPDRYETVGGFISFLLATAAIRCSSMFGRHIAGALQPRSPQLEDTLLAGIPQGKDRHGALVEVVQAIAAQIPTGRKR